MASLSTWNIGDWLLAIITIFSFTFLIWQVLRNESMLPTENISMKVAKNGEDEGVITVRTSSDFSMRIVELSPIDGCARIPDPRHSGYADYIDRENGYASLRIRQTGEKSRLLLVWRQPSKILCRPVACAKRITVNLHDSPPLAEFENWRWKPHARAVHLANMLFHRQWPEGSWTRRDGYWKDSLPEKAGLYPGRNRSKDGTRKCFECRHGSRIRRL